METRRSLSIGAVLMTCLYCACAFSQELVISSGNAPPYGPGPLIVIDDLAHDLPTPTLFFIAPYYGSTLPAVNPHGFAMLDRDTVVANNISTPDIVDLIDLPSGTVTAFFRPDATYSVGGSVAVNPARSHVLLSSATVGHVGRPDIYVVPTPLSSTSIASAIVTLPGDVPAFQTHAITFDASGRAFIGHSGGITAIDPPYAQANVVFSIALPATAGSYAIELSPDESSLLATSTQTVTIVHAPFSATSMHDDLVIPDASVLDAVAFVPDGSKALVVDDDGITPPGARLYAISAPFSSASIVETLLLPSGLSMEGFEDLDISADGQFAALAGQSEAEEPLIIVRAPFTANGFSATAIAIPYLGAPFGPSGRGDGTAHFWTTPGALPPQITIDRTSVREGNGEPRTAHFEVTLSRPTSQAVTVDYATADLTAHAGTDYESTNGSMTIPAGAREATIDVSIIGNTTAELDRIFNVVLSNASHAALRQLLPAGDGACTIVDDDVPAIVTDPPLPAGYVGVPYAATFEVVNFASLVGGSADNLPTGLSVAVTGPSTLTISGTPQSATIPDDQDRFFVLTAAGPFPVSATRTYELIVADDEIFADDFDP